MRFALSAPALHVQSGYGIQARQLAHRLKDAGHQVAVLAFQGHSGTILNIEGITHYPAGKAQFNVDVAEAWCAHFGADVLITISDLGNQDPASSPRCQRRSDLRPLLGFGLAGAIHRAMPGLSWHWP